MITEPSEEDRERVAAIIAKVMGGVVYPDDPRAVDGFRVKCRQTAREILATLSPSPDDRMGEPRGCPTPGACSCPESPRQKADVSDEDKDAAVDLAHAIGITAEQFTSGACDVLVQHLARHRARAACLSDGFDPDKLCTDLDSGVTKPMWQDYLSPFATTRLAASREGGELVELAIKQINGRFPDWSPTPAMLGYARAVGKTVAALASPAPMLESQRAPWDHGTANQAIDFLLHHRQAPGEETEFLRAWEEGALDEWSEYYEWLAEQRAALASGTKEEGDA